MNEIKIRIAKVSDAEELLEIYSYYVLNTAITFEYEVPTLEEFKNRIKNVLDKYPYIVAEENGKILGYAYAGQFHARQAYSWDVETSIYVSKDKKQNGIGKALYIELEKYLKEQNILNIYACIAYPEKEDEYLTRDSVRFHKALGYEIVGEFHECGYKFNRWYNMVYMEKHIGKHLENQKKIKSFKAEQ